MRPANFPGIRISQFAAFLTANKNFTETIFTVSVEDLKRSLKNSPADFWKTHFHFKHNSEYIKDPVLGQTSIENIIVNAIIPLRFAYAIKQDNSELKDNCIEMYKSLKAEKNHITNFYASLGLPIRNAFDGQAYIHLFNHYCLEKECLKCVIGHQLIHPKQETFNL